MGWSWNDGKDWKDWKGSGHQQDSGWKDSSRNQQADSEWSNSKWKQQDDSEWSNSKWNQQENSEWKDSKVNQQADSAWKDSKWKQQGDSKWSDSKWKQSDDSEWKESKWKQRDDSEWKDSKWKDSESKEWTNNRSKRKPEDDGRDWDYKKPAKEEIDLQIPKTPTDCAPPTPAHAFAQQTPGTPTMGAAPGTRWQAGIKQQPGTPPVPGTPWHSFTKQQAPGTPPFSAVPGTPAFSAVPGTPAMAFSRQPGTPTAPVPGTPAQAFQPNPLSVVPHVARNSLQAMPDPGRMAANILEALKQSNPKAAEDYWAMMSMQNPARTPAMATPAMATAPGTPMPQTPAAPGTPGIAPGTPRMAPGSPAPGTPGMAPGTPRLSVPRGGRVILPSAAQMREWGLPLQYSKPLPGGFMPAWNIPEDTPSWVKECEKMYAGIDPRELRWAPARKPRTREKLKKAIEERPRPKEYDKQDPKEAWRVNFPSFEEWKRRKKQGTLHSSTPVPLQPGEMTPRPESDLGMTPAISGEVTPWLEPTLAGELHFGGAMSPQPGTPR